MYKREWERQRESILRQILVMRENIKRLEKELIELGGYGNSDYQKREQFKIDGLKTLSDTMDKLG